MLPLLDLIEIIKKDSRKIAGRRISKKERHK